MNEATLVATLLLAAALPELLLGLLCLTGRFMPRGFARAKDPEGLRLAFGQGLVASGGLLLLAAALVYALPLDILKWLAPLLAAGITLVAMFVVLKMIRLGRR
ncbi:MAG TPA: hypothetical protein VFY12_06905 [Arenimonas sp.]|nr:hypothetical protein [Arenimonas sp.]